MKLKRFSTTIALFLGLLAMFIIPSASWQNVYAQGPDVEIADATTATIVVTDALNIPVGGQLISQVILNNPIPPPGFGLPLTRLFVEMNFPDEFVTTSVADIQLITPVGVRLGAIDTLQNVIVTNGQLQFEIIFDPALPIPADGLDYPVASIAWTGVAYSNGLQPITFTNDVEVTDTALDSSNLAGRRTNGNVSVDRPDITVFIDDIANPLGCEIDVEVGEPLITRVMADDVFGVDEFSFTLDFDERFIQVNEVTPGSFFGSSPIGTHHVDNGSGRITFSYRRGEGLRDAGRTTIAEIEWEGRSPGRSFQSFFGDVLVLAGGVNVEAAPSTTVVFEQDGCDIIVNPQEITIFFDPSSVVADEGGDPVRQEVKLEGVRNVEEVAFKVDYDQNLVRVVNPNGQPVDHIEVGSLFGGNFLEDSNRVDQVNGIINFRVNADTPLRQDGTVAVIYWQGLNQGGPKPLEFTFVELLDGPNSKITTVTRENGEIEVGPGSKTDARVLISPASREIRVNESGLTHIQLEGVQNLTAADVEVTFDPTIVEALHVDPSTLGGVVSNISLGNSSGVVKFTVSGINSVNTSGPVAFITWKAKTAGTTDLILQNVSLTQNNRETLPTNLFDGFIRVTGDGGGGGPNLCNGADEDDICGVIVPEGRQPNFGGVEIFLTTTACPVLGSGSPPPSGVPTTTTDSTGLFEVSGNTSYQCLLAVREGHLVGQHDQPFGNLGAMELPAGDLNGDNKINIFDLAIVGNVYQNPHDIADFNGNGTVDILDLALIARNYNRSGPVSDWR